MHVLIVKTSSLGDIVHTFPALSDAAGAVPSLTCDWLVEEAFGELPMWHPLVCRVIPVALRRWRHTVLKTTTRHEISSFIRNLRSRSYDRIIDAQGLIKSAILTRVAQGPSAGYNYNSAREPLASWGYQRRIAVPKTLHAVERIRQLCAAALDYTVPPTKPHYGIRFQHQYNKDNPYVVLIPATTWISKHWSPVHWASIIHLASIAGYRTLIPWHSDSERQQAVNILELAKSGELLPRQSITSLATWLAGAGGVIGVDTGLVHVAAAIGTPTVALYGPTSNVLTGTLGLHQYNLTANLPCSPCYRRNCGLSTAAARWSPCLANLEPALVWERLHHAIFQQSTRI